MKWTAITLMRAVSAEDTVKFFEEEYNKCSIRYGDMKKQLAADITAFNAPIYERILELRGNDEYLRKVIERGAEKAHASAAHTVRDVREIIGIKKL